MTDTRMDGSGTPKPEDWAGEMGARWLAGIDRFEAMIAPIGDALLARAAFMPGERVLDLGCGGGKTSLVITAAVGPSGWVTGIDISPDLITRARARAAAAHVTNLDFECIDAAVYQPDMPFDRMVSRFGSMFFPQPVEAFSNLHGCLEPSGRIDLAVWGPPRENPWMMEMIGVLRRHIEVPPAVPRAPGPFAFEDTEYLTRVLGEAGFGHIDILAYEGLQPIGGEGASPEAATDFALSSLAAGRMVEASDEDLQQRVRHDLLTLFQRHQVEGRGVLMAGKAWLATAVTE
ncbi:class I SAM-dependent methyltransferase [Brevundimonas variabilis]|uniref:SAM-dependent methyltransferase n=1 Tax=Brevundimonas variabilis TaxID=74312 RepID=A0A7W9CG23_9CAUL|nr:methyltransferase domain-containing protein [Brevundimonas variabilis]MBB5744826.1 SAM-dependent methyltransferase [Brevundimonas variabilis]